MPMSDPLMWAGFAMASSLVLLVYFLVGERGSRLDSRLQGLSNKPGAGPAPDPVAELARTALPKMGAALMPKDEGDRTRLQARLIHAGLYGRQAMVTFLGVKVMLMIAPPLLGLAAGLAGLVPLNNGLLYGVLAGLFGMVVPSVWLDRMKEARQVSLRRALPDAMDVLVICLEGGISFAGALKRVAGELRTAHPGLAAEFGIVQREVQLGRSTGEALRQLAERSDLEELRSLASVVIQAERYGASLVKALRVHAESLRVKRMQFAEEMAQKASVKVLFPTLLFIFPATFIVILGPAVIQLVHVFSSMKK
ncbi:MAG: type II secretion system F family protein [Gemmataceae bacterium]